VVGALKEAAFLSSHGPGRVGLTAAVLSDMLWSLWNTLRTSLKICLNRDLSRNEGEMLAHEVMKAHDPLIELWQNTIKNSRHGAAHEGVLPAMWRIEDEKKKQQLEEIKKRGADARWDAHPLDIPTTLVAQSLVPSVSKPNMSDLRRTLEKKLHFRLGQQPVKLSA